MTIATSVRDHFEHTLVHTFEVQAAALRPGLTLDELGLDSLAIVELIDIMAADLGVTLEDDAIRPGMTVDEVVDTLESGQR
ncbi:MAG TPA: phosphopantetheine-binding protein [Actinospica sp.]|jgi:acyl carrier protein|nr:phosphopantetheine-binding protein [Actinospica sp.]